MLEHKQSSWDLSQDWCTILVDYTSRSLTEVNKDKLRAIQGVANRIAAISRDEYVQGFFRKQLPEALLWQSVKHVNDTRAQADRAPSWSWASIDGTLDLIYIEYLGDDQRAAVCVISSDQGSSLDLGGKKYTLACIGKVIPVPIAASLIIRSHQELEIRFQMYGSHFRGRLDDVDGRYTAGSEKLVILPLILHYYNDVPVLRSLLLAFGKDGNYSRRGICENEDDDTSREEVLRCTPKDEGQPAVSGLEAVRPVIGLGQCYSL